MRKLNIVTIISILVLFTASPSVKAMGLFVEPFGGYGIGSGDTTVAFLGTSASVPGDYSGLSFGARAGLSVGPIFAGGEYVINKMTYTILAADSDIDWKSVGALIGFRAPLVGFRIWGTYYVSASVNTTLTDESGYGAGIGFNLLPYVAVNLEYRTYEASLTTNNGGLSLKASLDATLFIGTVSIPFFF